MKITCEHCGALIDTDKDKKCSNCGAPYSDNKEYKTKKEFEAKEKEAMLNSRVIGNNIAETALKGFKRIGTFQIVMVCIFVLIFICAFVFIALKTFENNRIKSDLNNDNYNDNYKMIDTMMYNSDLEIFSGNKNGFSVNELLNNISNKMSKYSDHIITVNFQNIKASGVDDITTIMQKISNDKNYNVQFIYDTEGYITVVNIS